MMMERRVTTFEVTLKKSIVKKHRFDNRLFPTRGDAI
jgi:hypothetical protein